MYVQTNAASGNEVVAYRRTPNGKLSLLGTFPTGGNGTGQPRSGTLSSYSIAPNGAITLLQATAGRTAEAQGPRDQDLSRDGRYLYVIDVGFASAATRAVNAFQVNSDGTLTKVGAFPLPEFPAVAGLAAY